jgi:hypothetical protein
MGVSKVEFGGETIMDISGDSVTPETLMKGTTAHNSAGEPIEGAFDPDIYQTKTDENLETDDKSVVGAINELNDKINATGGGSSDTDESMLGEWVFNDELEILPTGSGVEIPLEFNSNGLSFTSISKVSLGPPCYGLRYNNPSIGATTIVHNFKQGSMYGFTPGWRDEAYKTIQITEEPSEDIATWIRENAKRGGSSSGGGDVFPLPRIRFANFAKVNNEEGAFNYRFTVENLGGGTLQVGDKLQICCRRKYNDSKKETISRLSKLRMMAEYVITEDDINQRFLKIEVDPNSDSAPKWLFRNDRYGTNHSTLSAMYFRLKRVTKYDSDGLECNAIFSNVEKVWKTYITLPYGGWELYIK